MEDLSSSDEELDELQTLISIHVQLDCFDECCQQIFFKLNSRLTS